MATSEDRLKALAQHLGVEFKSILAKLGDLTALDTTVKTNLVAAINEVLATAASGGSAVIDDTAGDGVTDRVWSADKSHDAILEAINQVKADLIADAPGVLDTFKELAEALGNDPSFAQTIATGLAKRVRVDAAQTFPIAEKLQGRANLGAADAQELTDFKAAVGNTDVDFVSLYEAAKAAA